MAEDLRHKSTQARHRGEHVIFLYLLLVLVNLLWVHFFNITDRSITLNRELRAAEIVQQQMAADMFWVKADIAYAYNYLNAHPLPTQEQYLQHLASVGYFVGCADD